MMNSAMTELTVKGQFVAYSPITDFKTTDAFEFTIVSSKQTKAELCDFANTLDMAADTPDK
jgi:hypothetical protein